MKDSYLWREIYEQPQVLAGLIDQGLADIRAVARALRKRGIRYLMIAARGSSDNAATYAKYLFAALCRVPVSLATPSLYTLYEQPPSLSGALVVGISQSGQSTDILRVMREGARQGVPTLAVTNDPGSPLAEASKYVIDIRAGPERSVAATKTYTAQLTALALLAAAWVDDEGRIDQMRYLPDLVASTLESLDEYIAGRTRRYRYISLSDRAISRPGEGCVVIGRGYNYATAYEIALKLKELTYIVAEPYSAADFRHGPMAMVDRGFPAIFVLPSGKTYANVLDLARELRGRDAELLVISDSQEALALARTPLPLPALASEWLSPIVCVLPGQLLAYHLAVAKGYDPDYPRGLRKVTDTY